MHRSLERRESRPFAIRGGEGKLKRIPIMDLSVTGEGPARTDPTASVDAERLIREIRTIKASGRIVRTVNMLRPGRAGIRTRYPRI